MASFAENFRAGADVVGAGLDRSLRAQQLRLQEAQLRMNERQVAQQAQMYLEHAQLYKAQREKAELQSGLRKAAGENFAARVAAGEAPDVAFKAATTPLAIADPESYIEMQKAVFQPSIVDLKDSTGQNVPVIRTSPSTVQQVRTPSNSGGTGATTAMKDLAAADAMLAQANQLETAGDAAGAKTLRDNAMILKQSHTKSGGMTFEADGQGGFKLTQGGTDPNVPLLVTGRALERSALAQKAITDMDSMMKTLKPEHVGVKGVLGEFLFDRVAPQFGLNTADSARISSRTKIGMLRETLMRQVSADTRFSNMDAVRITKFLPSSGIFESMEHAAGAVDTAKTIMGKRALIDAQIAKQPPPYFAIVALPDYALREAVDAKLLTKEQAATEYFRRHPELEPIP